MRAGPSAIFARTGDQWGEGFEARGRLLRGLVTAKGKLVSDLNVILVLARNFSWTWNRAARPCEGTLEKYVIADDVQSWM
jgi:hypothetical protein